MGWIYGNNPVGQTYDKGRILCEAMYAVNEREYTLNMAITGWTMWGAYPAINAMLGHDVTIATYQTVYTELRTAVEALVSNTWGDWTDSYIFYPAGKPNGLNEHTSYYTKATLLTEAFGAADWCVLTGKAINDVQPITELLKAIELLIHPLYRITTGIASSKYSKKLVGGLWASPAAARTACEADAPSAWSASTVGRESVGWDPGNAQYDRYQLNCFYTKVTTRVPAAAAVGAWYAFYWLTAGVTDDQSPFLYSCTAGDFGTPTWAPPGVLRHTFATPDTEGVYIESLDDSSFLGTGANTVYTYWYRGAVCPFPDLGEGRAFPFSGYGFMADIQYTYN